jgi:Domain of unknown function (DUF4160)
MPRITTLKCGAAIFIYADDHNPPHFNLRGPDTDCNIMIETFEVYEGEYVKQALTEAKEWWSNETNRQFLRDKWRVYNERG